MQFRQTPNYTKGDGIPKIGWVLHGTLGAYNGAVEWLCNSNRIGADGSKLPNSSAHYVIGRNEGEVTQLVKNEDISWHAGVIRNPSQRASNVLPKNILGQYKNPNTYFCGIEFAWGYDINKDGIINAQDKTLTDWQYRCAIDIISKSGFYNPDTLLSHQEILDTKGDDMLFVVNEINSRLNIKTEVNKEDIKKQIINLINQL